MPPMAVATVWPLANSPQGAYSTIPTASMPRMRGNWTPGERPWRVKSSDRFKPKAFTRIRTWLGPGVGTETRSILRTSGPPGSRMITAFMSVTACLPKWLCLSGRATVGDAAPERRRRSGEQEDLSDAALLDGGVGRHRLAERKPALDRDGQAARLHRARDITIAVGVLTGDICDDAHVGPRCRIGRRAGEGHVEAIRLELAEQVFGGFSAHAVGHHVKPPRRHPGDHMRAVVLGCEDGRPADGAGGAGHQHRLARLDLGALGDHLAAGRPNERQRRQVGEIDVVRRLRQQIRTDGAELGVGVESPAKHSVPDSVACDAGPERHHGSRYVPPDDRGELQRAPASGVTGP